MNQKYNQLKGLLRELFQLDQPDLDFGIYRVLHARSGEIAAFLDNDLLPQVQAAFGQYKSADKVGIEKELAEAVKQAQALGMDPESTPKVKELRSRMTNDSVNLGQLENEVYDHLFTFFRRYYAEGDFLAKRVYKNGTYAIPYEGEEVVLHWANKDQYYIKTSEYLRDYAFRIRPENESDPMRVHFRLADAAEGEHGNVKAAEGKDRIFILAQKPGAEGAVALDSGPSAEEMVIRFEYRPSVLTDWPVEERASKTKPPTQKDVIAIATRHILGINDGRLRAWIEELSRPHVTVAGDSADYSRLEAHLRRYTARNTFDYFIHKDLGAFLRRELDFYIKNEVMHLDDVEGEAVPRVEQYLSKIKIIRKIAGKIIDFLAQLEDFQKRLWLKKKFVVSTQYCITVGSLPESLYQEIANNDAQREEWVRLFSIDEIKSSAGKTGYSEPLKADFLRENPALVVDTKWFEAEFAARLIESISGIDSQTDGLLVHSENFQALSALRLRFEGQIGCVYIDPPYNSKTSEIAYKNTYKHSSWLSLIADRLLLSREMSNEVGAHVVAIDENEQEYLGQLLSTIFPVHEKVCVAVMHNKKGIQGDYFSHNHEYAFFVIPPGLEQTRGVAVPESEWEFTNLRKWGRESERMTAKNCFYPIHVKGGEIVGFGSVCEEDFHPASSNVADGKLTLVYPVDQNGVERKWRYARNTVEGIRHLLKVNVTSSGEIQIVKAVDEKPLKTIWDDSRYIAGDHGTRWLTDLGIKFKDDLYPKSVHLVEDSIFALTRNGDFVLDYFGGSGTTAHAVINLRRRTGESLRFILAEMGDYFDTILLPRVKKITFSPEWKNGKPARRATAEEIERGPRITKVVRLESYEDSLNNLAIKRAKKQEDLLALAEAQGADGLREQYMLRYMLDVESRGSQSLLNVSAFQDPTAYCLRVKRPGSDESQEVAVDLLETFNLLAGIKVERIASPQVFNADFTRDAERRLQLKGGLKQAPDGSYWFRSVTGTDPDGRKVLVIWRKLTTDREKDNLVLDKWFEQQGYSAKDSGLDVVWTNGGSNLENLKPQGEHWKVRLLEEDFHQLMFEQESV